MTPEQKILALLDDFDVENHVSSVPRNDLAAAREFQRIGPAEAEARTNGAGITWIEDLIVNAIVGRLFCGFGCPIGQASRMGDSVEVARRSGDKRLRAEAEFAERGPVRRCGIAQIGRAHV